MASSKPGGFSASEVARLVAGYLQNSECPQTKDQFVEECSPDLKVREFSALVDQGILRTFDVDGLTLTDILNEYAEMKTTLNSLIQNEFKPDEVVMYKSDGPLRKLKILTEHWMTKFKENGEKCSPSKAEDSSVDPRPRSRNSSTSSLKLHHPNLAEKMGPKRVNLLHIPVAKGRKQLRYSSNSHLGSNQQGRSRNLMKLSEIRQPPQEEWTEAQEIGAASEIQRMLNKPQHSAKEPEKLESPEVFKTPSPVKSCPNTPKKSAIPPSKSSPLKSRKSQLKSRVPTKKTSDSQGSMPILVMNDYEMKINKALEHDDGLRTIGEPIANAIKTVDNVENFMANSELMDSLLNILEDAMEATNEKPKDVTAPPSNSSSALAIDDEMQQSPGLITDDYEPDSHEDPIEAPASTDGIIDKPEEEAEVISKTQEEEMPRQESIAAPPVEGQEAISQVVAQLNQELDASRENSLPSQDLPKSPTKTPAKDAENSLESIKSLLSSRGVDVVSSEVINLNSKNVVITNEEDTAQIETIGYVEASSVVQELAPAKNGAKFDVSVVDSSQAKPEPISSLRRSSRTRKVPSQYSFEAKKSKRPKKVAKNPNLSLVPTIQTLVSSDARNLQLVNSISESDEKSSVAFYMKLWQLSSFVTSTDIEEAETSGVDLDQVYIDQLCFPMDSQKDNLKEHIIEDSVERDIMNASSRKAGGDSLEMDLIAASKADEMLQKEAIMAAGASSPVTIHLEEDSSLLQKMPAKSFLSPLKRLEQDLIQVAQDSKKSSNDSISLGDLFNTPKKAKSPLQMSEESRDKALAALFKTPVKDTPFLQAVAESMMKGKKTPLTKFAKKSPMPSPFLGSPGTPAKDVSIASISFNQDEHASLFTPSIPTAPKDLSLDISPSSLHTPSPRSSDEKESPLITPPLGTPPLDPSATPNDKLFADSSGSLGPPRTPRGKTNILDDFVMSSPLKRLKHLCEVANEKLEDGHKKTFVFLSPSKRRPKRAALLKVDTRSPLRSNSSSWEARHDVNNLDHYQTIVKESEATSSSSGTSRKRKASGLPKHEVSKKAKIDINMELVPQLTTTPRKISKKNESQVPNDLPNALGLVPKTPENARASSCKTPKSRGVGANRKSRKTVQRNLLDEDGFLSPRKKAAVTPKKTAVTPIKLKSSPGKSRFEITPPSKGKSSTGGMVTPVKETPEKVQEPSTKSGDQTPRKNAPAAVTPKKLSLTPAKSPRKAVNASPSPKERLTSIQSKVKTPIKSRRTPLKSILSPHGAKRPTPKKTSSGVTSKSPKSVSFSIPPGKETPTEKATGSIESAIDVSPIESTSGQSQPMKSPIESTAKLLKSTSGRSKIQKSPLKSTPRQAVKTPPRVTRKVAAASPAKIASAFLSPLKNLQQAPPASPAKTVLKASLLSLSQTFSFYDQEPWDA